MNKIFIGIIAIALLVGMAIAAVVFLGSDMLPPYPIDPDPTDPDPNTIHTYEFSTVGYPDNCDDVCRGCFPQNVMWLGFRVPANSLITRVQGEIKMDLLGNNPCEVWFDIWDNCNQQYLDAVYVIDASYIHDGRVAVDFDIPEQYQINTYWIGFIGCGDVTAPYNKVTEFDGTIYYKQGSDCGTLSILSVLNPFRNLTPSSQSSCNNC